MKSMRQLPYLQTSTRLALHALLNNEQQPRRPHRSVPYREIFSYVMHVEEAHGPPSDIPKDRMRGIVGSPHNR
ncbi:hypothetical protein ALC56_02578 [Trachymyrmex septentrionalis]|uniref:Uncharacterized protein n=1 Tax=Trachymyrmex septentrionalis TaxID=34720 RepID=A0A195FQS3_9HYME|nr:hypothetical protein ALC56_02578 [Trachymyrmex septentrionalis]